MTALRLLLLAVVIASVAISSGKQLRRAETRGDVEVYIHGARLALAGQHLYTIPEPRGQQYYNYLPLLAVLSIPLTVLPIHAAVVGWCIFNVALVAWIVAGFFRAMAGRSFFSVPERTRWIVGGIAVLLTLRALLYHLDLGQANLAAIAVAVLGCYAISSGRAMAGGAAIGIAIVLKMIVLPVAIPFVVRAHRAAAGIVAGVLAGLLLPALVFGLERNQAYVWYWLNDIILGVNDLRQTRYWPLSMNYSLAGQLYRFFGDVIAFDHDGRFYSVTLARLPDSVLIPGAKLVPLATAILIAAYAWLHRRRAEFIATWGAVAFAFCLAPAFSLLAHKHYYVMLLPAHLYVVYLWYVVQVHDRWFRGLVAASFVISIMSTTLFDFVGALMSNLGGLVWGSVLLAAAIWRAAANVSESRI